MGLESFYHKHYKGLLGLTIVILLLCIFSLFVTYARTGQFVKQSVSLKGGITVTVKVDQTYSVDDLSAKLPAFNVRALEDRGKQSALIFETAQTDQKKSLEQIKQAGVALPEGSYTTEFLGSSLGAKFYRQTIIATLVAFVAMSLVVFITFRNAVPSSFVILAAFSDIVSTLAIISFLGVELSTAGIAAFLMLIGYSVDTDILLTTRVLKHKEGTLRERINSAARTGLTMSLTSFIAMLAAYFFSNSDIIRQIMLVLCIGLAFDIMYTWLQNATILRLYLERRDKDED